MSVEIIYYLGHKLRYVETRVHFGNIEEFVCETCKYICWRSIDRTTFTYLNNDKISRLNITCDEVIIKNIIE